MGRAAGSSIRWGLEQALDAAEGFEEFEEFKEFKEFELCRNQGKANSIAAWTGCVTI